MGNAGAGTGINFDQGQVELVSGGDLQFVASNDGTPELVSDNVQDYSLDVTAQNVSKQQCQNATTSAPDASPITNFYTGLLFCVGTNNGIALLQQTEPLGSSNILHLQETYWPSSS